MENRKIVPTITTIIPDLWREKLAEVKKLKLKEVCLFLTCLGPSQRKEFYSLFKETGVKAVPLVHIRSDMALGELDYLAKTYRTKAFNTHTKKEHVPLHDYGKYKKIIYIEKTFTNLLTKKRLKSLAAFAWTCPIWKAIGFCVPIRTNALLNF